MSHIAVTIFGWLTAAVAAVAFIAGPASAARIAGNALGTVGITAGALAGGFDDLFSGFSLAKDAAGDSGISRQSGFMDSGQQDRREQRQQQRQNRG